MTDYFGKYRGKVEVNVDPQNAGRVMVSVPAVTGSGTLNWAMPSSPSVGFIAVPPVGANVWVEYEGGNPDQAIYSGCFWDTAGSPLPVGAAATPDKVVVLKSTSCTVTLSDLPGPLGGVTIEMATGMKVVMTSTGVEITNGQGATIKLAGPKVSINGSALEVT
jgi:hypothetical protein